MPAKPGSNHPRPQTDCRILGNPRSMPGLIVPTSNRRTRPRGHARPQEPWLGSSSTLHYARPIQGNASQPRLSGKDRRYSLSFLPCSRQPRCAQGRAVACLSQSSAFTRRPAASTTLSQA